MKLQLLRQVKDAEDAGATQVAEAEAKAKTIVADARRKAEQATIDGKAAADATRQAKIDDARTAVQKEADKLIAAGEAQAANLRAGFEAGVDGAAGRVLKIIEESF